MRRRRGAIVVVGGYGAVGRVAAAVPGAWYPGRVFAPGRDARKAGAFSRETGRQVLPPRLDLADARSIDAALDGARLAVVCAEQGNAGFARACLDRGVHYVDASASYAFLGRVERLDTLARGRGVTAVLSVGLAPGLTNLLARRCVDARGAVRTLDISILLGPGEPRLMPLLVRHTRRRGLVTASLGYGTRVGALASGAVPLARAARPRDHERGAGQLLSTRKVAEGSDGLLDDRGRAGRAVAPRIAFRIVGYVLPLLVAVTGSPPIHGRRGCPAPLGR